MFKIEDILIYGFGYKYSIRFSGWNRKFLKYFTMKQ